MSSISACVHDKLLFFVKWTSLLFLFILVNCSIQIAITGKGFCKASSIATGLIMNNILRIGKVNVIGDIILFLGKLCVSLFCALFAFLMLDTYKYKSAHNRISSPLFPVLVRFPYLSCHLYTMFFFWIKYLLFLF